MKTNIVIAKTSNPANTTLVFKEKYLKEVLVSNDLQPLRYLDEVSVKQLKDMFGIDLRDKNLEIPKHILDDEYFQDFMRNNSKIPDTVMNDIYEKEDIEDILDRGGVLYYDSQKDYRFITNEDEFNFEFVFVNKEDEDKVMIIDKYRTASVAMRNKYVLDNNKAIKFCYNNTVQVDIIMKQLEGVELDDIYSSKLSLLKNFLLKDKNLLKELTKEHSDIINITFQSIKELQKKYYDIDFMKKAVVLSEEDRSKILNELLQNKDPKLDTYIPKRVQFLTNMGAKPNVNIVKNSINEVLEEKISITAFKEKYIASMMFLSKEDIQDIVQHWTDTFEAYKLVSNNLTINKTEKMRHIFRNAENMIYKKNMGIGAYTDAIEKLKKDEISGIANFNEIDIKLEEGFVDREDKDRVKKAIESYFDVFILDHKANKELIEKDASKWLQTASRFGNMEMVEELVDKLEIYYQDLYPQGYKNILSEALVDSCYNEHIEIAKYLIDKGAKATDKAYSLARTNELKEMLEVGADKQTIESKTEEIDSKRPTVSPAL